MNTKTSAVAPHLKNIAKLAKAGKNCAEIKAALGITVGVNQIRRALIYMKIPRTTGAGSGPNSVHWKGGRRLDTDGYVMVYSPGHPGALRTRPGASVGYVPEHRLVMEKKLGRFLKRGERVIHIDKNGSNNALSNLRLAGTAK